MYRKAVVFATPDPAPSNPSKASGSTKKSAATQASAPRVVIDKTDVDVGKILDMILTEQKPGRQKELARSVRPTSSQLKVWEKIKFDVVAQGSYCKYSQNTDLRDRLLATGDQELVEASPQDRVWGIGMAAEFAEAKRT
ncbi:hypothetical protein LTR08_005962 [Meristemomyces frigidus]|nr:hypothetical protein LTR08_005962 [Meristemomyces frigidus]